MTEERDKSEFKETENKAGQQPTGQKKPGEAETDKGFIGSQTTDKDDSETGQPARSPDSKKTDVEQGSGAA
jgi:hypothetical protein